MYQKYLFVLKLDLRFDSPQLHHFFLTQPVSIIEGCVSFLNGKKIASTCSQEEAIPISLKLHPYISAQYLPDFFAKYGANLPMAA